MFGALTEAYQALLHEQAQAAQLQTILATDDQNLSAEALADKAAGFHPMPKPPAKGVTEHPGPQKHDAGAVPMKALRIGWDR